MFEKFSSSYDSFPNLRDSYAMVEVTTNVSESG